MHNGTRKIALLGAVAGLLFGAACAPDRTPEFDDSPEGLAFEYRHSLMTVINWKLAQLRAISDGELPADDEAFVKGARDLSTLTGMINEAFPPGSNLPGSRALPVIWERWDDFTRRTDEMQRAADSLVAAAESGGISGADNALRNFAQSCGNCHRTFRAPDE